MGRELSVKERALCVAACEVKGLKDLLELLQKACLEKVPRHHVLPVQECAMARDDVQSNRKLLRSCLQCPPALQLA